MIKQAEVPYGDNFIGNLFLPEGNEPHPCIILFHTYMGKDSFMLQKAEELVSTLGVATFCADLYGNGKFVKSKEEATQLMQPLVKDPQELRRRTRLAFETVSAERLVKKDHVGAIGFCFGGHATIELFKSGVPVKGACAFHPVISKKIATSLPIAQDVKGKLLLLLGYQDPLIDQNDLHALQEELKEANIDWQTNMYGLALHAFTNPEAHDREAGLVYNSNISLRAFAAMSNFFLNTIIQN